MTTLICPVRPGDSNEELRYALRSWETNLVLPGGLDLWVVGHCPAWLDPDRFTPGNRYASAPIAVWDNVLTVSEEAANDDVTDAVYMNDDFFCLDPVGAVLPVRRNVDLAEHRAQFPVRAGLWWPVSLDLTASWLSDQGYPSPWSYEVHRPLPAPPERMFWALSQWDGGLEGPLPQWRTVYGTLCEVDAYPVRDVKLGTRTTGVGSPWISTSDQSWPRYRRAITERFPKPSRWEG